MPLKSKISVCAAQDKSQWEEAPEGWPEGFPSRDRGAGQVYQ